ncbi:MAG: helix-turn-helix domain-containing protein [Gemmatimonadetes bacterium]|nr:helix-turn-helix domain-containing protein [Gemmatimonadota bacterium]
MTMDTREKLIDARIGMLALADELKNISRACQVAGISRTHYYDIKDAFERYGRDGLAPRERRRPRMPNETPPELVARILEMTAEYPTYSYVRVSQQLRLVGVPASAAQVRGVWLREGCSSALTGCSGSSAGWPSGAGRSPSRCSSCCGSMPTRPSIRKRTSRPRSWGIWAARTRITWAP